MHLGDTNIEEGRGAGFGLYTWTVIKVQQVLKPLSCRIWMWGPCPPSCIYFCAVALCWLGTLMVLLIECSLENPLGVTQPVLYFLSLSTPSLPFYHLSLSLCDSCLFNRGAIRREGDTGESWGHPESHSGCGTHCPGDSKRVHFHPTHGFGLWPHCGPGISTNIKELELETGYETI